ncbi:RNA polymerase-binding protein RbpA [Murinocardiopsis flavida]|nr:RNA polymerase-binding protein RbpA [Murinocardiopsis flavida]
MGSGSAIRGSRVGAGPMGEAERGESAPRVRVAFYCANKHQVMPSFAHEALVPEEWDCPRCGFPAGQDPDAPPAPPRTEPYKTHLAYVKERRTVADGQAILDEALEKLRANRAAVEAAIKANAN